MAIDGRRPVRDYTDAALADGEIAALVHASKERK